MKQVGLRNLALFSLLLLLFSQTVFAADTNKDIDNISISSINKLSLSVETLPVFYDTFYVCPGNSIFDTLFYSCSDVTVSPIGFEITNGPGSLITEISSTQDTIFAYYSYTPQNEGEFEVVYLLVDENSDSVYYNYFYMVNFENDLPVIEDQYFASSACDLTLLRELQIVTAGQPLNGLTYSLISGQGTIDAESGLLTYQPDTSGIFEFMVVVETGCGADTAMVTDSIHLNTPPQVFCYDSLVTLCDVEEICFDVFGLDVDSDPVELFMLEGIGNFSMTSDSTGEACFIPADVDSAVYRFIFRGADSCSINSPDFSLNGGECCRDTSLITVVINRPPVLACPEPQSVFICDTTEFCVDLSAYDYENSELTYNILSGNAILTDSTVCVTGTTSGTFDVVIEAVDDCGHADTCTIPVTVNMNDAPVVNSAEDFAMNLCEPEAICFTATADDLDFNIADISVNFGTYNNDLNQICFTPDTSGVYSIVIVATDSCGLVDSSVTNVTVHMNEAPTIDLGLDYALEICATEEICIEPLIVDESISQIITNFSFYNDESGQICFVPDTSGRYQIIAEATDDCGLTTTDTINIDVTVLEKATLELGDSLFFSMCLPEEICVDVLTNVDYSNITYNYGQLNDQTGQICFTPDTAGVYTLNVEAVDSCGFNAVDTKVITVEFKSDPVITNLEDTSVYICKPISICLPVSISDLDNDIVSIVTSRGSYADGAICFVPYDSGSYDIILTVTDSCGNVAVDTAYVNVQTDQGVSIVVPNDTSFFTCQLDTFCFPISGIPVGAEVTVSGINTWYDEENSQICYYAECSNENKITVSFSTECNTFTEEFTVQVNCNTDPLVILPQDTTIFLCELVPISLPIGVTDVDGNLINVSATGGTYDSILNLISFTPDSAGTYFISVLVTDSCEATDYDEIAVTIVVNEAPVCVVPENMFYNFCEPTQISLPVYSNDADGNNANCEIISGGGQLIDGNWVYNAVGDDSLTVTIRCTDECGAFCEETFTVQIHMNNAPQWDVQNEFTFEQCNPTEVFIPFTAFDIDGDDFGFTLLDPFGLFVDSGWIYTPIGSETIEFTARVEDSCSAYSDLVFSITFKINEAPILTCPTEQSFFGCAVDAFCFDISAIDPEDGEMTYQILSDNATLDGNTVCMTNLAADDYEIIIEVTDDCGHADTCVVPVTIGINQPPVITLDDQASFILCQTEPACLDILITDPESDFLTITLSDGAYFDNDKVCFAPDTSGTYMVVVTASDNCANSVTDTALVTVVVTTPPIVDAGDDFIAALCVAGEVCLDVTITDDNLAYTSIPGGYYNWDTQQYCFNADTAGSYDVVVSATDSCGNFVADTVNVNVTFAEGPTVSLGEDLEFLECTLDELCIDVTYTGQLVDVNVSGGAEFNSETSQICFTPESEGLLTFIIDVVDTCGLTASDTVNVNIELNERPIITDTRDSTVYLCAVEEICFDISATDPDGDPVIFSQYSGIGTFTQLTDTTGRACFTPDDVDSATYTFVYCVTDSCSDNQGGFVTKVCDYTYNITVFINRPPQIVCPDALNFFTCEEETFCFDVDANDPEFAELTFNILSGNATIDNKTVCFVGNEADSFDIVVEVVDDCGHADTCSVPVIIKSNRSPYVTSADDFSIALCDAEPICFNVNADDLDFNLDNISVNFGTYNSETDQVCFDVDSSGVYTIITTATDSCGAIGEDTTVVTIELNLPPVVIAGEDFAISLCTPGEVCFDVTISDNNRAYTSIPKGHYNWALEQYCFNADTSGVYEIEVSATDSCGLRTSDTIVVTVNISQGPFIDLGNDLDIFVCELGEYCIDVSTIVNFDSIVVTGDAVYNYETSQLCVNLTEDGNYFAGVQVFDTCGLSAYDEINVNVTSNQTPIMSQMPDTSVYLCQPTSICLPLDILDDNLASVTVNRGSYENGQVCFVPYDSGSYEIIVTAIDSCGVVVADTANVHVSTDQGIELSGQADTTIFVCELDTMCFPVYGIPEGAEVTVSGINTWYNAETSEICYYAECSSANKIKVTASTACGSFEYSFTVTVVCNTAPLVILPQDTTITVCGAQDICLPLGITDVDKNLGDVNVTGGSYDPILSLLCVYVDTAGTYIIGVNANDTCGASDYDEIAVTVVLNSAPVITKSISDSLYMSCGGSEICFPVDVSDVDNNLLLVTTSFGTYSSENGNICFVPDTTGTYCIEISATDSCGLITTDTACLNVEVGGFVQFECPTVIVADSICGSDSVCVPLAIDGEVLDVQTSIGFFENGQFCFFADTAGLYTVSVTATADCNEISCEFTVEVNNKIDVEITCPDNLDTLLCGVDTLYFDYTVSSSVVGIIVSSPAYISNNQVVVPIESAGSYTIDMAASGACGIDTCSFTVNTRFNTAPTITSIDTTLTVCAIDSICLPFEALDIDTNLVSVTSSVGVVSGNTVCVLPIAYGQTSVVLTATDACGETKTFTSNINLTQGATASIICPQDKFVNLCGPDSVCVVIPITPFDADITILDNGLPANANFDAETGNLCLYVDQAGLHNMTIIADAMCGADTCNFEINVAMSQLPTVSSPATIDTLLCLAEATDFCFDVETSGTGIEVTINPAGTFTAGVVCIPVDTAGTYNVEIIASNNCGADTSYTTITVKENIAPVFNLPETQTFQWCPTDTSLICIDGISATDAIQVTSFEMICGEGNFTKVFSNSGAVCFIPDTAGMYMFCFEASDGCQTVTDTFYVEIQEKEDCDVCVRLSIIGGEEVPVGVQHEVILNVETNTIIGGFDVLISFDASVMTFNTATIIGTEIEGWEYFTYRLGSDDCGANCPSGLVRLVGLADLSNGPAHPPAETLEPNGTMVAMNFLVANDQNLGDLFLPIEFAWYDCGDNTFSNTLGSILYVENRIFNSENILLWDEADDVFFPETSRPFGMGANDQCMAGASSAPIRCIDFINGGIKVIHPDSIDDRGDINLNNIAYEIGDAVLYSNYFIYGLGVFTINVAGQIAASDVNADGLTLSVADLVLMIRVIVGDADPVPKLVPYTDELKLENIRSISEINVTSDAVSDIGGMFLVYDLDDNIDISTVKPSDAASGMQMMYNVVDNQLRILMYDMGRNYIDAGENSLVEILFDGSGEITLSKAEIVDYQGRPYKVLSKLNQLPEGFALSQNYPNPFNPSTTIELALPLATDWTMSVYNINGHLVREFYGNDEAGLVLIEWDGTNSSGNQVASGMYLYRIEAAEFSATKKMILLK